MKRIRYFFLYILIVLNFSLYSYAENFEDWLVNFKKVALNNGISENTFRVLIGPFANLKTLQNAYNSVKKLDFENIEIIKNEK